MVGLQLGWGPKKTEMVLPGDCDPDSLPLPREHAGRLLPDVVTGFKVCLGVPRHPTNEDSFIATVLEYVARRHDNLLERVANVLDEDLFTTLRLLQLCGVNKFGDILSVVPPDASYTFCDQRDGAITAALGAI
jgi:hypothetical protein